MKKPSRTFIREIEKENKEMLRQIQGILNMKTDRGRKLSYIYDLIDARVQRLKKLGY